MIVAAIRMKFITTKIVWSLPIIFDVKVASIPWQQTQARKTA